MSSHQSRTLPHSLVKILETWIFLFFYPVVNTIHRPGVKEPCLHYSEYSLCMSESIYQRTHAKVIKVAHDKLDFNCD